MIDKAFLRTQMLLGQEAMEKLAHCHIAVLGLGGVGSWCVEALARSGVGELTLIDCDEVSLSNLNRQLEATRATVGQSKPEAMADRIRQIAPACILHPTYFRYTPDQRESFFAGHYDFIVDCIDTVSAKLDLIQNALARNIPIISALGTGNKLDPTQFRITDISKSEGCHLARIIRKELRDRGIRHHRVLWSPELPHKADQTETPPPGRRSVPGSVPWVPPCAGMMLAGDVILSLTEKEREGRE